MKYIVFTLVLGVIVFGCSRKLDPDYDQMTCLEDLGKNEEVKVQIKGKCPEDLTDRERFACIMSEIEHRCPPSK